MMNKQKGNMYGWVTHTWNVIKGRCPHNCTYCYMIGIWNRCNSINQRFDEKELKTDLGSGNVIFVGSSTDMFAEEVSTKWIEEVLKHCRIYSYNKYLFQTKNPSRFEEFKGLFPKDSIYGTTMESNKIYVNIGNAPRPFDRFNSMCIFQSYDFVEDMMVSIEPIMDFDLKEFVDMIKIINPRFVSIGADSKDHNLPEPSWDKVQQLIIELKKFTEVKVKDNLKRLKNKQR